MSNFFEARIGYVAGGKPAENFANGWRKRAISGWKIAENRDGY